MTAETRFNISRWAIFLLIALAIVLPLVFKFELPSFETPVARAIYDKIESMEPGDTLLLCFNFDPASQPELEPMATAILEHCHKKQLRVIAMTFWGPAAVALAESILKRWEAKFNKRYGEDYVFLGFKPGLASVIITMGQDMYQAFPEDNYKHTLRDLPVMRGIKTLGDIDYVIDLAAGATTGTLIVYGVEKYKITLGAGCTAVSAAEFYPYLQTKQINGLLKGLSGASQYEGFVGIKDGPATDGMRPQSVVQSLIIFLVIVGNIIYFRGRRKKA